MLGFFDMFIQVVQIIEPRCALVVLNDGQFSVLSESSQLAGTHPEILCGLLRPQ